MEFRAVEKEPLTGLVPLGLCAAFRENATRERQSLSEAISEALCNHIREDPRKYGITPSKRRKSLARTSS